MTKPDDIPQDVWNATDPIGEKIFGRHENGFVMWPLVIPTQEAAARAIMAEREARTFLIVAVNEAGEERATLCIGGGEMWPVEEFAKWMADWAETDPDRKVSVRSLPFEH